MGDIGFALYDDSCYQKMAMASSSDAPEKLHWTKRGVCFIRREPGHVRIFSLDDIGRYVVTYEK